MCFRMRSCRPGRSYRIRMRCCRHGHYHPRFQLRRLSRRSKPLPLTGSPDRLCNTQLNGCGLPFRRSGSFHSSHPCDGALRSLQVHRSAPGLPHNRNPHAHALQACKSGCRLQQSSRFPQCAGAPQSSIPVSWSLYSSLQCDDALRTPPDRKSDSLNSSCRRADALRFRIVPDSPS